MLIDQYELFSSAQAITAAAASTNLIDMKATARYLGAGARPLYVVSQVTTAFTDSSSDSELALTFESDDDVAFGSVNSSHQIGRFSALAAVGDQVVGVLPAFSAIKRYGRIYYTPEDGDLSAGAVTTWLTPDPQVWQAFAKGYTGPTTA